MFGIIYKATNTINGKMYIGKTIGSLEKRKKGHFRAARNKSNLHFPSAIRLYGEDIFIWEIIDNAHDKIDLNNKERYWIKFYLSNDVRMGYNLTLGGDGNDGESQKGKIVSEQARQNLSKALTGRKLSAEHSQKIGKARKGIPRSEETKKRMSESQKGIPKSAEHTRKNSESHKGLKPTQETIEKRRQSMKGKNTGPRSEEVKNLISEKLKGREVSAESLAKRTSSKGSKKMYKDTTIKQVLASNIEFYLSNGWNFLSKTLKST